MKIAAPRISQVKKLFLLLVVVSNRLHKYNFGTDILCNLLDLELTEMSGLDLDLAASYCDNTVLGGLNTFADFLALTYIDFHYYFLPITSLGTALALIYQLVCVDLYLFIAIPDLSCRHEKAV
jgi:hypothetical protein